LKPNFPMGSIVVTLSLRCLLTKYMGLHPNDLFAQSPKTAHLSSDNPNPFLFKPLPKKKKLYIYNK